MAYYHVIQLAMMLMAFNQLTSAQNGTDFNFPNVTNPNNTHGEYPPITTPLCMMPTILCLLEPYIVHLTVAIALVGLAYWQREVIARRTGPILRAQVYAPLRRRQAIQGRPADAEQAQGVNLPAYQPYQGRQGRQGRDDGAGLGALPLLQAVAVAGLDAGLGQ